MRIYDEFFAMIFAVGAGAKGPPFIGFNYASFAVWEMQHADIICNFLQTLHMWVRERGFYKC